MIKLLNINIPEGKKGKFEISNKAFPPGHEFDLTNHRNMIFGGQNRDKLTLDKGYIISTLLEKGNGVWMTNLPIEQAQHYEVLAGFYDNILVGGLGLGLAVTVLSENKNVRNVTVIEKSKDVIDLVWKHLDIDKKKCFILNADLFEYLEWDKWNNLPYDFSFYDIWQSDSEGTFFDIVIPLRKLSRGKVKDVRCWNENVMRGQLRFGLLSRYCNWLSGNVKRKDLLRTDNKWLAWSAPFFAFVFEYKGEYVLEELVKTYVESYGMSENWIHDWEGFWL